MLPELKITPFPQGFLIELMLMAFESETTPIREINFILDFGVLIMFTIVSKNILSLWIQKFQLNFSFSIFKYVSQRLFKYYLKSKNLFIEVEKQKYPISVQIGALKRTNYKNL